MHHYEICSQIAFSDRKEETGNGKDVGIVFPHIIYLGSRKEP